MISANIFVNRIFSIAWNIHCSLKKRTQIWNKWVVSSHCLIYVKIRNLIDETYSSPAFTIWLPQWLNFISLPFGPHSEAMKACASYSHFLSPPSCLHRENVPQKFLFRSHEMTQIVLYESAQQNHLMVYH